MLLAALSGPASPPVLGSLARLFAGENVPAGVEGNVQDGAAATTAALGVEWGTLLTVLVAFAVGVNIIVTGIGLISESVSGLLDKALPDEEHEVITEILRRRTDGTVTTDILKGLLP
mgnify:FL=1